MKIIWKRKSATVRDVYEELLQRRKVAYTTVMSALKTLEHKGYLQTTQRDRAYVYEPTQPRRQVIQSMVREFVQRVFNGSAQPLVVHLLEDKQISEKELREVRRMMERKK